MRVNRPCIIREGAKTWPAFNKWNTENSTDNPTKKIGADYLLDLIGPKKEVRIYRTDPLTMKKEKRK